MLQVDEFGTSLSSSSRAIRARFRGNQRPHEAWSRRGGEVLTADLAYQLTNALNPSGYVLTNRGPYNLVFRRARNRIFIFGLAFFAIGLLATLGGAWYAGIPMGLLGAAFSWLYRPATVAIQLRPEPGGTVVTVSRTGEPGLLSAVERAIN